MKKLFVALMVLVLVYGGAACAMQPAIIGGIRDGLAVGIMADESLARNVSMRLGVEANTGSHPGIIFFGGKFYLTNLGRSIPLSLGFGFVGYFGGKSTDAGFSLSFIFDRMFNVKPLFFEFGVDVAGQGRLQAQFGYNIY